jgi:hypothetical protein
MKNMYSKLIISLCVLSSFAFAEKFTVAGINFESPKNWESSEPSNNMRKAQFSASSPTGKTAEVVFYYFGSGNTGGIQANVDRWMKQFEDPQDKKVNTETINKTRVTYAQAHGTFLSGRPFGPKTPNPGYGLLAAIIEGEGGAIFIKITGPKSAVEANIEATKKMVTASLTK